MLHHRARVDHVDARGIFVVIPKVSRTAVFGPCPTTVAGLAPGDPVLVAELEGRSASYVVLGSLDPTAAPDDPSDDLAALQAAIDAILAALVVLQDGLDDLGADVDATEADIAALIAALAVVVADVAATAADVAAIQADVTAAQADIVALQAADDEFAFLVNTDGNAGRTIYVGSIDPDVAFAPVTGDVWIEP